MMHLRYEAISVFIESTCSHYEGGGWDQEFWHIWADDYSLAEYAEPFAAEDAVLTLNQCTTCGRCGMPVVCARRTGKQVIWFIQHDSPYQEAIWPQVHLTPIAVTFDVEHYRKTLPKGDPDQLPNLTDQDWLVLTERLQELISHRQKRVWDKDSTVLLWPQAAEVFQRTPHCESDYTGLEAIQRMERGLLAITDGLKPRPEPTDWYELHIKITLPDFPEAVWRVGETAEGLAFCFLAFPLFPVWCGHERLDEEFGDYFRQTLLP